MGWYRDLMHGVGKAIPNEFSKTASVGKHIPYIGQAMQAVGSVDAYATGYADMRDKGSSPMEAQFGAVQHGMRPAMGQSVDPGYYGSPNVNRDAWNTIGQLGNLGSFGGGGFSPNVGGLQGIMNNPYLFGSNTSDVTVVDDDGEILSYREYLQKQSLGDTKYGGAMDFILNPGRMR
jgi:hypothetical protein